jgi:hypothetical protein
VNRIRVLQLYDEVIEGLIPQVWKRSRDRSTFALSLTRWSWLPAEAPLLPSSRSFANQVRHSTTQYFHSAAPRRSTHAKHKCQPLAMAAHPSDHHEIAAQYVFPTSNAATKLSSPDPPKLWPIFGPRQTAGSHSASGHESDWEDDEHGDSHSEFEGFSDDSNSEVDYDSDEDDVDSIEREIDYKNRLFKVDEDGLVEWYIREPSYTQKGWIRRGKYSSTLLYSTSSPAELRQYVKDRNLPDPYPQGITLKYFYILALDRADKIKSFYFLDLIPEMRNLIYKKLLVFGVCENCPMIHEFCQPAILQTSKQIYKEAREILYAENTITCFFAVTVARRADPQPYTRIHTAEADGYDVRLSCVFHGMSAIPDWFRRIQSLKFTVDVHGNGSLGRARSFAQGCTLNLASFLMDKHCLKKLQIHIINHLDNVNAAKLTASILYPLRRLRGLSEVRITGNVDPALSQAVAADMQRAPEQLFNTVPHLYKLRAEGWAFVQLAEAMDPLNNGGHFDYDRPDSKFTHPNHVRWLLEETSGSPDSDSDDLGLLEDSDAETNTRHKMDDLRSSLDRVNLSTLNYFQKDLVRERKTRTAFAEEHKWIDVEDKKKKKKGWGARQWKSRLLMEK